MSFVKLGGAGDKGVQVEGFGEFGENGVEHVMFVCFEREQFFFAGDDDLVGWSGVRWLLLGRERPLTVAYR
jgi:hypothetical protein